MSGLETVDGDATDGHNDSNCGQADCTESNQSPSDITNTGDDGSQGGGLGSFGDSTFGVNQPSNSGSSSFIIDNTPSDINLGGTGAIDSDQIEHFCMHHHNHARCVNHTFDIGSSITSEIAGGLGSDIDVPIGINPTFDDYEDPFAAIPVDTTAADISAISLPLGSTILNPKPIINIQKPSSSSSSSSSSNSISTSSSTSSSGNPSTSILIGSFNWITFSTTKNTYSSLFSYRPCITIYVPEVAMRIFGNFNLFQQSVTLCFSLPPLF